ncbi:MAG: RNA:NAD 2'-phosphotransferase [uncultured Rubrobacteraceae bacterium]|uniref:Probable RNA 2'-phosphotransferase n=1 Tax=uncultured Rubrobacteraceae bacterium TaxID=349277 RepID=A0A6J4PQI1_9ACTN|nr:MAG: RNA:NAD 2'-phosphotransferase [uncultured Rubrobacteraceae bacterium]
MRGDEDRRLVRVSKYLSKYLRHRPEELGLVLMPGGWVEVDALLAASVRRGFPIGRDELEEVVARNDKKRFAFDESGALIRAQQGHSASVDLELEPATPPATLYHGTPERNLTGILQSGLLKMRRHHVHLSPDEATARVVGARRGRPVVLAVDTGEMHRDGHAFYRSGNGVWLVEHVPPRYLSRL